MWGLQSESLLLYPLSYEGLGQNPEITSVQRGQRNAQNPARSLS
jgi:hypothetical protein